MTTRRIERNVALDRQDLAGELRRVWLITAVFDFVEPVLELVDLGPVVVDHAVDDPVHQGHRALAQRNVRAVAQLRHLRDAAAAAVVDRHEIVAPEKEVDVGGLERVFRLLEVDAVQDDVEVVSRRTRPWDSAIACSASSSESG